MLEFSEDFFREEDRMGFHIEAMMKKAWAVQISVLAEIDRICEKYNLQSIKFYTEFELGEVTSKRDYVLLTHDYECYYAPCDEDYLYFINYSEDGTMQRTKISRDSI